MDEFFKRLRGMRGQFEVVSGMIRHSTEKDSYGEYACPLVAATGLSRDYDNLEPYDAGKEIGLRRPSISKIVVASDWPDRPQHSKLRRRILEAVGLEDTPA